MSGEDREYLSHEEIVEMFDGILNRMQEQGCLIEDVNVVFSTFLQHIVIWNMLDDETRDKVLDQCEAEIARMMSDN